MRRQITRVRGAANCNNSVDKGERWPETAGDGDKRTNPLEHLCKLCMTRSLAYRRLSSYWYSIDPVLRFIPRPPGRFRLQSESLVNYQCIRAFKASFLQRTRTAGSGSRSESHRPGFMITGKWFGTISVSSLRVGAQLPESPRAVGRDHAAGRAAGSRARSR
jgi:hypothetical protein